LKAEHDFPWQARNSKQDWQQWLLGVEGREKNVNLTPTHPEISYFWRFGII
jgi:hypothetical protein